MRKEMLTPSRCREELKKYYRSTNFVIWTVLFPIVSMWILVMGFYIIAIPAGSAENERIRDIIAVGGPIVLTVVAVILMLWGIKRKIRRVDEAVLEIVEDTLLYSYIGEERRRSRRHSYTIYFYVLVFRYFGHYRIPARPHYSWSKLYSTDDDEGVYNHAEAGDTFYVVLFKDDKRKKPLLIYNTKEFVYCPDGTTEHPEGSWRDSVSVE